MKLFYKSILTLLALSIFGIVIVKNIQLKQNCTGYLKRAAYANTVETAIQQLDIAISYLEENKLTNGYTSILWKTPDEDIEFWYKNLKSCQIELLKVNENTSSLEKTNLLMKLRETLIDNGEDGDTLTIPKGLAKYPNNLLWATLLSIAGFILLSQLIKSKRSFVGTIASIISGIENGLLKMIALIKKNNLIQGEKVTIIKK